MTKPKRDDADVDAGLQEVHGRRVADDVRGDTARGKLRLRCGRGLDDEREALSNVPTCHYLVIAIG